MLSALIITVLFRDFLFSDKMLLSYDIIESGIFFHSFLRDYIQTNHSLPLWNPYQFCGLPFIDAVFGNSGALYPFSFITWIGSIPRAIGFNLILHYLAACVFAYAAAREIGLRPFPAFFAGIAYGFSPTLVSWVYPGHDGKIFVSAWFPLAVYLTERLRKSPTLAYIVGLGLVLAMIVLTPHLQAAFYVLLALALYAVIQIAFEIHKQRKIGGSPRFAAGLAIAVAIGLAVSSVQWIPGYRHITEFSPRAENERGVEFASTYALHSEELVSVMLPEFCGVNILGHPFAYWGKSDFKDNSEGVGVLPWLLAVLALLAPGFRRQKVIWATMAAMVLLYSLGNSTPLFRLFLAVVPGLDRMRAPSTSMFIAVFAIALLAGIGLQNMLDVAKQTVSKRLTLARIFLIGCAALFLSLWLISIFAGEQLVSYYVRLLHPDILSSGVQTSQKWTLALNNLPSLQIGLGVGSAVSIFAWAFFFGPLAGRRTLAECTLALLLIIGSYQFNQRFILTVDPGEIFGDSPVTEFLASHQGNNRTHSLRVPARWFKLGNHGVYSPGGENDKAISWYVDLIGGRGQQQLQNPRVLNLTGTHYLIARAADTIPLSAFGSAPFEQAFKDGEWTVYRNPNSLPRAFFASEVKLLYSLSSIYEAVRYGSDDLRRVVYLERRQDLPVVPTDSTGIADATIIWYSPDSVCISVKTSSDRVLVLTDTYHPNWKAYVDKKPVEIRRAYGAFRAVLVPAGSSSVVFRYEDGLHRITMAISLASLATCGVLLGIGWVSARRSRSTTLPNQRQDVRP